MPRYVYLAGPIAGVNYAEATDWRHLVTRQFTPGIVGVSPMRLKEWYEDHDGGVDYSWLAEKDRPAYLLTAEQRAIAQRDFMDVARADLVLAYLPEELNRRRSSWGTAIELGLAWAQQKPLVLVTDDTNLSQHPLVRQAAGWIVPTLELGVEAVNSVLGVYA